ncbi:MAG: DinB family protein [Armatimonas sp.]
MSEPIMDPLDIMLLHDRQATRMVFDLCRPLGETDWDEPFPFGQGSLRATFHHFIDSMEYWMSLIAIRPFTESEDRTVEGLARRYELAADERDALAVRLRGENRWSDTFIDTQTEPTPCKRTLGSWLVHSTTHNMHHRAQILVFLDQKGIPYNPFAGYAMDGYPLDVDAD